MSSGPHGSGRRQRTKFDQNQRKVLIEAFEKDPYPDINVRQELARRIQVLEPRIQVWFQNRRSRTRKNTQKRPSGEADATALGSLQGGGYVPDISGHRGLLPRRDSNTLQSYSGQFSCEVEDPSGQAVLSGHAGVLGMNVGSSDLDTPARALEKPSADFHCSPSMGFSFSALGQLPAPQQPISQVSAGGRGTRLGDPRPLMAIGDWALKQWGQHPPSDGQQPWWGGQPPSAQESGMVVPQQPLSTHPGAWEQPTAPPPPPTSAQKHCLNPADSSPVGLHTQPGVRPAGRQEQVPSLPSCQDLGGGPSGPQTPAHCSFRSGI